MRSIYSSPETVCLHIGKKSVFKILLFSLTNGVVLHQVRNFGDHLLFKISHVMGQFHSIFQATPIWRIVFMVLLTVSIALESGLVYGPKEGTGSPDKTFVTILNVFVSLLGSSPETWKKNKCITGIVKFALSVCQ